MEFGWSEKQKQYRNMVVEFAKAELNGDVPERDAEGRFPREAWTRCARFGIQGLAVPPEYGGGGVDAVTLMMAMEALGYGCTDNGLLFALGAQMWAAEAPIMRFGTEMQKRRYLPGLCDGSLIGAHALTEPTAGSDAMSLSTLAVPVGQDTYVLNGNKVFITNAPVADLVLVFARQEGSRGIGGLTAFLVDVPTPGLTVSSPVDKMGLRTAQMGEVRLEDCRVPGESVLGRPGGGLAIFNHAMEWERSHILAGAVGTMQRQLERSLDHVRQRHQFGQPIGKFQGVTRRIVDIFLRVRTGRLLLYELAWLRSEGRSVALESAMAKLWVSECFLASSLDALFLHGGYGYLTSHELERDVRDAVAGCIYSGTSDMQRNIIAGRLGL